MTIDDFHWNQPQPRIVQHQKRRYALRLEGIFWQQLEKIARRREIKLGALVAQLAESYEGANLSSFVRGYCMVDAERENARYRLGAGAFDLMDVLRAAPAPALILNQDRIILETNQALLRWMAGTPGTTSPVIPRQQKFDLLFIPRIGRPLDETVEMLNKGELNRAQFQVTFQSAPDQPARTALATMISLPVGTLFYVMIWLTVNPNQN